MTFQRDLKPTRRQNFPAILWRMHLLVSGVGLMVIGIISYGFYIGERLNTLDEPLIDAVMEIQLEARAADLWFREVIRGNMTADLKTIKQPLEQAVGDLQTIAIDSKIHNKFFSPLKDNETRELIDPVQQKLAALQNITELIVATTEPSGSARELRLQYEEATADLLDQVGRLGSRLLDIKAKNLRHFRYLHLVLIFICIALFLSIALAFQLFLCRRIKDYDALREAKQKLETENAERLNTETELKKAHQELEERVLQRTAELSRINKKLKEEITERLQVEQELQQSKSMLQGIFDGIPESLTLVDRHMGLKMINKSAAAYYKVDNYQDAVVKPCLQIAGNSTTCDSCRIPAAVQTGRKIMVERKGLMSPERIEQVTVYPLEGKDVSSGDAIIRVTDITETRLFERRLIQSEKMASLGIMVSSVAHEINNPNSFVSFNIPILMDYIDELLPIVDQYAAKCPDLEFCRMPYDEFRRDIFRLMDNVKNGADRISSFVANLREFSKSDGDRIKKYVDFKSVIEKVLAICGEKLKSAVKSFEVNIPPDLPQIYIAPYAMEQVLINLLMNAAQAADKEDSRVELIAAIGSTWREHFIIEIIDNGCGIDEKSKIRLFDPFYTTKLPCDGTGLGLYVCHNLVQGIGGRIEVESEPGNGSKFTVILPEKENRQKAR